MAPNGIAARLTPAEIEQFETALRDKRRLLTSDVQSLEDADTRDPSEVSSFSTHLADLGSDRAESDVSLGRRASASSEIQEIDEALERIQDGSFGLCESCEKPIARERLEAIPYARLCMPCKIQEEE